MAIYSLLYIAKKTPLNWLFTVNCQKPKKKKKKKKKKKNVKIYSHTY